MFGSVTLEVAIGLVMVYLLLSMICSILREGIEAWFKTRAVHLEQGIRELLNDKDRTFTEKLYNHPFIFSLFKGGYNHTKLKPVEKTDEHIMPWRTNLPSYIPAENFAFALMDIVAKDLTLRNPQLLPSKASLEQWRDSALRSTTSNVQRALLSAIDNAQNDINKVQANLEAWYNSAMDRVSGWYKRETQILVFLLGLIITVLMNANTITITEYLFQDDAMRKAVVAEAKNTLKISDSDHKKVALKAIYTDLNHLGLPLGWPDGLSTSVPKRFKTDQNKEGVSIWYDIFMPLLGWLLTAFAISLGAPFWFDTLNKFMTFRSASKPAQTPGSPGGNP